MKPSDWFITLIAAGSATIGVANYLDRASETTSVSVANVVDGDTVHLASGTKVRLLCIDAPELAQSPFGEKSRRHLQQLLDKSKTISLSDYGSDRYGRTLGILKSGDRNLNVAMVRDGYAFVYPQQDDCPISNRISEAASEAQSKSWGVWDASGICKPWNFRHGNCAQPESSPTTTDSGANCHPSYPNVCIKPPPPDLDCSDVSDRNFQVTGSDPHNFDGNDDGIGCSN
jgi:micrococcal nuclease